MRQRLTLLLICSIRSRRWWGGWFALCCSRVSSLPRVVLVGMRITTSGSVNARNPRSCKSRLPGRQGRRRRVRNRLIVNAAAIGVAQEEDEEERMDQQDIFDRVIS